jgi:1,4-alpha-glucan branching enzyme
MRKDSSNQKTKETQFSLEAVESKKVSLVGEFNIWNPDADCVSHTRGEEPVLLLNDAPFSFHFRC